MSGNQPKLRKRVQPAAQPEPAQPPPQETPQGEDGASGPKLRKRIQLKTSSSTVTADGHEISVAVENKQAAQSTMDLSEMCGDNTSISLDTINLVTMGNIEIARLSSSSNSRQLRHEVEERMKKREQEYVPKGKTSSASVFGSIASFSQSMKLVTNEIEKKSVPYTDLLKLVDTKKIQPTQILFRPNTSGIASIFDQSANELYADATREDTSFTIEDMQRCLNVPFIKAIQRPNEAYETDIINGLITASSDVIQKHTYNNYIMLGSRPATNVIIYAALILMNGMKVPLARFFNRASKLLSNQAIVRPYLSMLAEQVNYVSSTLIPSQTEKNELRLGCIVTLHMLRNCFYAPLINFIYEQTKFKQSMFYDDAVLMNTEDVFRATVVIETIESCQIEGNLMMHHIPEGYPTPAILFTKRMHGALKDYVTAARNELMCNDERVDKKFIPKILDPVRLTIQAILMQSDGSVAKPEAIYDLLQAICNSNIFADNPFFPDFKRIIEERHGKLTDSTMKKLLDILPKILESGMLPFLLPFASAVYTKVRALQNSVILGSPFSVIKISFFILQIGDIRYKFTDEDLMNVLTKPTMLQVGTEL